MPAEKDPSSQKLLRMTKIGLIAAAHGIRGEVKIRSFADPPEAIFSYPLTDASGKRSFALTKKGGNEKAFITAVEGISDRNEAEWLKGTELYAPASALPQKDRLIGLEARLADGRVYGRIARLYNFGAGDIIEIELTGGKTEMLPFAPPFIGDICEDKGYVIIVPPDYVEGEEKK